MEIDIDKTLADMFEGMSGILLLSPDIQDCVKQALAKEKDVLSDIANKRKNNEITDENVESHLQDEKLVLEAALLACKVKAGVKVLDAADNAISIFKTELKSFI